MCTTIRLFDNRINVKKAFAVAVSLASVLTLVGCTNTAATEEAGTDSVSEQLLDPVVGTPAYDEADYRDIYDVSIYNAYLCPVITEYTYESESSFGGYSKLFGEEVLAGDILLYGNTDDINTKIEELTEKIDEENDNYDETYSDYQQDLAELLKEEAKVGSERNSMVDNVPDGMLMPIDNSYRRSVLARERKQQEILELEQKHNLSKDHNNKMLSLIEAEKNDVEITSNVDGVVVAAGLYSAGDHINQGSSVVAVADTDTYVFRTEFIDQTIIAKAQDLYILVNGKRYDVVNREIDHTEYKQLLAQNGAVYSEFYVQNDGSLSYGQYGVLVVEKDVREDVLCVPSDAVLKEGNVRYVNLYVDGTTKRQEVSVGLKSGMYIEILDGLKAGDKVLSDLAAPQGKTKRNIEKGTISGDFSETGYMFYPSTEWIQSPIENATSYLKEILVEQYEQVEEGQTIATLEVYADQVEADRIKRKMQRENERLSELLDEQNKDYSGEANIARNRAIRGRRKTLARLQKDLDKINKYSGLVEIKAPYTGTIMYIPEIKPGDLIYYKENLIQMSNFSKVYFIVEDKSGRLNYGNDVTVSFKDNNAITHTVDGTVVSVNNMCLSTDLKSEYSIVAISPEIISEMLTAGSANAGNGWYRMRFNIETEINKADNVLLIPKSMVKEVDGSYYVRVQKGDKQIYTSFVPGGSDTAHYWVACGLSEGVEICSD